MQRADLADVPLAALLATPAEPAVLAAQAGRGAVGVGGAGLILQLAAPRGARADRAAVGSAWWMAKSRFAGLAVAWLALARIALGQAANPSRQM